MLEEADRSASGAPRIALEDRKCSSGLGSGRCDQFYVCKTPITHVSPEMFCRRNIYTRRQSDSALRTCPIEWTGQGAGIRYLHGNRRHIAQAGRVCSGESCPLCARRGGRGACGLRGAAAKEEGEERGREEEGLRPVDVWAERQQSESVLQRPTGRGQPACSSCPTTESPSADPRQGSC